MTDSTFAFVGEEGAPIEPVWPHDSTCCVFVGREYGGRWTQDNRRLPSVYDLYVCGKHGKYGFSMLRRESGEPSDYSTPPLHALDPTALANYPWAVAILTRMATGRLSRKGHPRKRPRP